MYNNPMVEKSLIQPSCSKVFAPMIPKPFGPMIIPDRIKPMIPGILAFLKRIGESKMIKSIMEKTNTGLVKGKWNSFRK